MCPDPALLAAYLDRTLFSRDASLVDAHMSTCQRCAGALSAMRLERSAARPAISAHRRKLGVAVGVVAVVGIGALAVLPGSKAAPAHSENAPVRTSPARVTAVSSEIAASAPPVVERSHSKQPAPQVTQNAQAKPGTLTTKTRRAMEAPSAEPNPPSHADLETIAAATAAPSEAARVGDAGGNLDQVNAGVTLRGRKANRRILWRTRDLVIEHSTDSGATWVAEHTADRPIRAGAFVAADVAWFVGNDGLVLRRTKQGWFGASPPADGHVTTVRASSPSKATVTIEDGRVFTTDNGGVTWSAP